MNQNDVLKDLAESPEIKAVAFKLMKGNDLYQDLIQYMLETIASRDEEKNVFDHASGKLKYYCFSVLYRGANSVRSPFFRQYHDKTTSLDDLNFDPFRSDDLVLNEHIQEIWEDIVPMNDNDPNWYEFHLFELYKKYGTITKTAEETGIPFQSISDCIKKYKQKVLEKL